MTLKDRYEKLIKKVNDLNAKKIRLEGNRDALMNNLKEYGCSNLEEAEKLAGLLKERYPDASISIQELGPVIGCHVGPGFLAFVYLSDKESRVA